MAEEKHLDITNYCTKIMLKYRTDKFKIDEFFVSENTFPKSKKLQTWIQVGVDTQQHLLAVRIRIIFSDNKETPYLAFQMTCMFIIEAESWETYIHEGVKLVIPREDLIILFRQAYETTRGALWAKTLDLGKQDIILPDADMEQICKENFIYQLNTEK